MNSRIRECPSPPQHDKVSTDDVRMLANGLRNITILYRQFGGRHFLAVPCEMRGYVCPLQLARKGFFAMNRDYLRNPPPEAIPTLF